MPGMLRIALAQLRHRAGRTAAMVLGIVVATTSFTVLTGAARVNRLEVHGLAVGSFRSAYDLLVRPPASYTPLETQEGLVRPNYQSGIFGGITMAQYEQVRRLAGVEVAAPVANIGYLVLEQQLTIPLGDLLTGERQQLFRIRPRWTTDRGTSTFTGAPQYVYVSRNPATAVRVGLVRGSYTQLPGLEAAEVVPGRKPVPMCANYLFDQVGRMENDPEMRLQAFGYRNPYSAMYASFDCFYRSTPSSTNARDAVNGFQEGKPAVRITVPVPVLLAAVDPEAESRLFGLDKSLVSGRMLTGSDAPDRTSSRPVVPVIATSRTAMDSSVAASIERVAAPAGRTFNDLLGSDRGGVARIAALRGTPVSDYGPAPTSALYEQALGGITVNAYWTAGASGYRQPAPGKLAVQPVTNEPIEFAVAAALDAAPVGSDDVSFRRIHNLPSDNRRSTSPELRVVGRFAPDRTTAMRTVSGLSSETYSAPELTGATETDRRVLGDRPLLPAPNLAGYAAQPPALLTTLSAMAPMFDRSVFPAAGESGPISVIRIRVAGVTGPDDVSRERLNQVALAIKQRTGLAVDIVAGASAAPQTVTLPAGSHGRPQLRLTEAWARKGVAFTVVRAADRKSLALFGLILVVCAFVVANAASASVRTRRADLGMLSCLGWPARRLFGVVLAELAVAGLVSGLAGLALAVPLARAAGVPLSGARAGIAVGAAVLLALLAGVLPAARASRAQPLDAVQPLVAAPRRGTRVRGVWSLAVAGLRRTPGRSVLAVVALAAGVASLGVLLAVQQSFRGTVVGSLLGDAVAVQARTADVVAVVTVIVLGLLGIADVGYLSVRERAGEFAVLRALGWPDSALVRLVVYENLALGLTGGLLGAFAGGVAIAAFTGGLPASVTVPLLLAAAAGPLVATVACVVPVQLLRRLPTARLVAED